MEPGALSSEEARRMTKKTRPRKSATAPSVRPVEIRYGFQARVPSGEDIGFNITASRLKGSLDLRVSLRGENKQAEFLPLDLFEQVQMAATRVADKVSLEDLEEHED
jgi:hypothetical protein